MNDRADKHDRVSRMVRLAAPAETVWAEIGGFGAIADWHPLIESCELTEIEGEPYRRLTLSDGGSVFERLVEAGPLRLSYEMVEGPLPATDYRAAFTCVPEPAGGCHVYWSAYFEPPDGQEHAADELVGKIFEIGLDALADRYG